jgi:small basic protein (TIGR04137 family)
MSQHRSFLSKSQAKIKKRNVLKRFERLKLLKKKGIKIKNITGLPK